MTNLTPLKDLRYQTFAGFASVVCALNQPIKTGMVRKRLPSFVLLLVAVWLTAATGSGSAQTINCPSGFNTTTTANGACGVSVNGGAADFWIANHPSTILSGAAAILSPVGAGHQGNSLIKQTKVNNQAFSTTFTFVPNGLNLAFVLENQTNQNGQTFSSGAGGEGGFSQFAGGTNIAPNNVFALELDSYSPLTNNGGFSYSSAQIYQTLQAPYIPLQDEPGYLPQYITDKISTSPVSLNSPMTSPATTTGDTYSANITYDGYTLTLKLFDVTAGGSCPGATCFTHAWTGVYIPEITGATTSYAALIAGTSGYGGGAIYPLDIKSFTYTVNAPTGKPNYTAWNANSTDNNGASSAASPVYSVAPGTYPGTQTVAISTSTSPHNYICYVLSSATPTLYPQPDNNGGCNTGTLYTGPVSIASTATLYAMAGSNNSAFPLGSTEPTGLGPPSTLVAGTYTISASAEPTAATPTFSPAPGTYSSPQSITLTDASPAAVICFNTTGSPRTNGANGCASGTVFASPITVSSSEAIYAVAGGTGYTDSPVASSSYTIQVPPPAPVATTATLTAPTTHLINGQQASITATITPASGALPTGNVSFYVGSQLLGYGTLSNGQTSFLASLSMQPGSYQVTASYNGSALDKKSTSAPLIFSVLATTAIGLSSNATQIVEGSPIILTAAVTPTFGDMTPTGSVAFYVGATALGTQRLSGGTATDNAQINLPAGRYQLTAVYTGDGNDESSTSNSLALTVLAPVIPQASTSTVLTIMPAQPAAGQSMQLSSVVTAASGSTPTGVVNYYLGQTQIGSASLTSGAAGVSVNAPSTSGSYLLTAVYAGTSQNSASSSAPVMITIAPSVVSTSISLVASAQQVIQGQSFALSATVASNGSTNATGTVNFFLGQTQLGSIALTSGQASWTGAASFAPGTYQAVATYSGDPQNSGSTSSTLPFTILPDATIQTFNTTVALTFSPQQLYAGQNMSISVQVAEQDGASSPAGSVAVYLGQTQIGTAMLTNGSASLSIEAPSAGTYTLTANYTGVGQDLSSQSPAVALIVNTVAASIPVAPIPPSNPTFTLSLSDSTVAVAQGQSGSLQVSLLAIQGYQGAVQLTCSGLPAGVSCNFSPATVSLQSASANSVLSISSSTSMAYSTAMVTNVTYAMLAPWNIVGLLGIISGRRRRKSRFGTMLLLLLAATAGLFALSGCGLSVQSITRPYQVSVTALGANQQSQTQTFTLNVTGPAAIF